MKVSFIMLLWKIVGEIALMCRLRQSRESERCRVLSTLRRGAELGRLQLLYVS